MEGILEFMAPRLGLTIEELNLLLFFANSLLAIFVTAFAPFAALYLYVSGHIPDHITYSLNNLREEDGKFVPVRTVLHLPRGDIVPTNFWLNIKVWWAQRKCTCDDSLLRLNPFDMRKFLPQVTSGASTLFADGFLAAAAKLPVHYARFRVATFYECYPNGHANKLHVLVVLESELQKYLNPEFCKRVETELPKHKRRVDSLRLMAIQHMREENYNVPEDDRLVRFVEGAFRK